MRPIGCAALHSKKLSVLHGNQALHHRFPVLRLSLITTFLAFVSSVSFYPSLGGEGDWHQRENLRCHLPSRKRIRHPHKYKPARCGPFVDRGDTTARKGNDGEGYCDERHNLGPLSGPATTMTMQSRNLFPLYSCSRPYMEHGRHENLLRRRRILSDN